MNYTRSKRAFSEVLFNRLPAALLSSLMLKQGPPLGTEMEVTPPSKAPSPLHEEGVAEERVWLDGLSPTAEHGSTQ